MFEANFMVMKCMQSHEREQLSPLASRVMIRRVCQSDSRISFALAILCCQANKQILFVEHLCYPGV